MRKSLIARANPTPREQIWKEQLDNYLQKASPTSAPELLRVGLFFTPKISMKRRGTLASTSDQARKKSRLATQELQEEPVHASMEGQEQHEHIGKNEFVTSSDTMLPSDNADSEDEILFLRHKAPKKQNTSASQKNKNTPANQEEPKEDQFTKSATKTTGPSSKDKGVDMTMKWRDRSRGEQSADDSTPESAHTAVESATGLTGENERDTVIIVGKDHDYNEGEHKSFYDPIRDGYLESSRRSTMRPIGQYSDARFDPIRVNASESTSQSNTYATARVDAVRGDASKSTAKPSTYTTARFRARGVDFDDDDDEYDNNDEKVGKGVASRDKATEAEGADGRGRELTREHIQPRRPLPEKPRIYCIKKYNEHIREVMNKSGGLAVPDRKMEDVYRDNPGKELEEGVKPIPVQLAGRIFLDLTNNATSKWLSTWCPNLKFDNVMEAMSMLDKNDDINFNEFNIPDDAFDTSGVKSGLVQDFMECHRILPEQAKDVDFETLLKLINRCATFMGVLKNNKLKDIFEEMAYTLRLIPIRLKMKENLVYAEIQTQIEILGFKFECIVGDPMLVKKKRDHEELKILDAGIQKHFENREAAAMEILSRLTEMLAAV